MTAIKANSNKIGTDLIVKSYEKLVAYHTGFNGEKETEFTKDRCYFCKRTDGEDESSVFINGQPVDKPLMVNHYCFPIRKLIYVYPICDECAVILSVFSDPVESGLKVLGDESE